MQIIIFMIHPLVGWAFCGTIMWISLSRWPLRAALLIHAVGGAAVFAIISFIYFTQFNFTPPATTALTWMLFVVFMDLIVVALLINKSLDMFKSPLGTWIPFGLIYLSTYLIGTWVHFGK